MKPSAENLRRELLPDVSTEAAVLLEGKIRDFITARELPLYRMMSFQLGWIDENGDPSVIPTRPRTHGQFALAVASAISETDESDRITSYAVAIELLHNFTLIHEDVEDGNTEHNGRPSVWWTWGPAQAINAGDGMHAMARMALFALTENGEPAEAVSNALRSLDHAAVLMCEGEYVDIAMQEQLGLTTQKYIDMVCDRSGALFGATAQITAYACEKPGLAEAILKYGQLSGAARQIAADYMLFWGGEALDPVQHGRLLTKKKNLPVAHAIETAPPSVKRRLGDIYVQRVIDPARVGEITELLDEAGSKEFTLETARRLTEDASEALQAVDLNDEARQKLSDLTLALSGFNI